MATLTQNEKDELEQMAWSIYCVGGVLMAILSESTSEESFVAVATISMTAAKAWKIATASPTFFD